MINWSIAISVAMGITLADFFKTAADVVYTLAKEEKKNES